MSGGQMSKFTLFVIHSKYFVPSFIMAASCSGSLAAAAKAFVLFENVLIRASRDAVYESEYPIESMQYNAEAIWKLETEAEAVRLALENALQANGLSVNDLMPLPLEETGEEEEENL
jgi:hypothetical protein